MTISEPDKFLIKKLIDIRNKGYYASGREATDVYNRVFNAHLSPTSCGSCIRTRINLLERELRKQEELEAKALEEKQAAENNKTEEGKEEDNGSKTDEQQTGKRLRRKKGNQA